MLNDAAKLMLSGRVTVELWIAAALFHVGTFTLVPLLNDELFPDLSVGIQAVLAVAFFLGIVGTFVTAWKLTRALARATADERGFVGSWVGWGIVAIMPCMLLLIVFEVRSETFDFWWFESIAVSLATCLMVPILVHSTGRAINDSGPSVATVCNYWFDNYGRLFVAYFWATAPLTLVSDGMLEFGNATQTDAILRAFVSNLLYFASALLAIAVTVVAYREADAANSV